MSNPLLVNAAELLRRPGSERSVAVEVALSALDVHDPARFAADAVATVELRLEAVNDGIVVDGTVSVPWHGTCRRCLDETGGSSVSEVHELYQRALTDPDAFEIVGDQLDLGPLARELVLLDAPSTPLCRPACAGLCPKCGANLNHGVCGCPPATSDSRWGALDRLRDQLGGAPDR
jgi:uncharacterized protein